MKKDVKILLKIKDVVNRTAPNSDIILYGSRARGDSKLNSDWDVLILLSSKNISFDFETQFMDVFYELEIETGEVISPLIYTKTDWFKNHVYTSLYENVEKDGIRIK
ncbi:MAG: nucleotidyltransferase domain-containing protein [Bacteroidetes bacterium]|nr:nucleotidyltransferase domain-containing protein [Bacteroidota bacterium]